MQFFIKQNYYFDIDERNQLRITGPENHLFLGMTFPQSSTLTIASYGIYHNELIIAVDTNSTDLSVTIPLVCDVRTLRSYIEPFSPRPTYRKLAEDNIADVLPKKIEQERGKNTWLLRCSNEYEDEEGNSRRYGCEIHIPLSSKVKLDVHTIHIQHSRPIRLIIHTNTNITVSDQFTRRVIKRGKTLPVGMITPFLHSLYVECGKHIQHLVRTKKTSSFEYGTIFPRDWIESADLGFGDLTQPTIDYMYTQSMKLISQHGEGWHENAVGEYRTKFSDESQYIDRKMIDIEPRYILGLPRVSKRLRYTEDYQNRMRLVAQFLIHNATINSTITFKKTLQSPDQYQYVGNWRDSYYAYPRQKAPLAPYDVNCVFYPLSLHMIAENSEFFQIHDHENLEKLISRWDRQKLKFRLYHPDEIIGYSLALHGKKSIPLPIPHLDESYDLFYGSPSLEEVASFAKKIVNSDFFYTPVGPLLVSFDEDDFTTAHYHGRVIWPKQAAFSVAGLSKQYWLGRKQSLPSPFLDLLKDAILTTCEACFKGWKDIGSVPELYCYDAAHDKARLYIDQETYEGQMSTIQLWSAVGCRRIISEYIKIKEVI